MTTVRTLPTFTGEVRGDELGTTLIHEHVFVGHQELDLNLPHPEWDEQAAIGRAVAGFERLYELGVRTVVDLTVLGQGRDAARVQRVAERTRIQLLASTGYYTPDSLPHFFHTHGPGRSVGGPDPLVELFIGDIERGIAGTQVRAAMLKIASDAAGLTSDIRSVFEAAAVAHLQTGVPITTHTHAASRGGLEQQRLLSELGVPLDRVVIGHSGDSTDVDYLHELAAQGSFLGFDRFGMEHLGADEDRIRMLLLLLEQGYEQQLVLSHDAAFFSRVTPPSWRAIATPNWHMEHLFTNILPRLRREGVDDATLQRLMVDNPRRVLCGS